MENIIKFDINESVKQYLDDATAIQTPEADATLLECSDDPEQFTTSLIASVLDPIVESVVNNPEAIARSSVFDTLQCLLKFATSLPPAALSKTCDIIISGLSSAADTIHHDLETEETAAVHLQKQILEQYGFLLQWCIAVMETKSAEKPAACTVPSARSKNGKVTKTKAVPKGAWDSAAHMQTALDTMCKVLKLRLSRLFPTTSQRDTFVALFTRPIYLVLEREAQVKSTAIKMHSFKVLCIAVKHYGHAYGAQTSIIQSLSYFEHLAEPMAEFLHILAEQYDYPQLTEEILRELSAKEFNINDARGPKSVSTFIAKLSELAPRLVIKQMTLLAKFLDSESYPLRCSIIEVCGNLIAMLSNQEAGAQAENHKAQINAFFEVLEDRFLDVNPYCRCRTIQVYMKLCELETKFPHRRQVVTELATRSLEDKSSNVRRNAVKLIAKLISTHPFGVLHGGQLSLSEWQARLDAVTAELNILKPANSEAGLASATGEHIDEELLDDATEIDRADPVVKTEKDHVAAIEKAQEDAVTAEAIGKLNLTLRYYNEALKFIDVLHQALPLIVQLLMSKNKSEVIEAMDFFLIADAYKLESAKLGIRKMLHLIWTKGNSDEGKGVQAHLIDCYKSMFFDAPDAFNANDAANYIARNMISLTFSATLAELTSLEQLLSTMMKADLISDLVVSKLWQIYGVQRKEISKKQRRGAIIVLGMLALTNAQIVVKEMELLLSVGLGYHGRTDLGLAKYTCVALARIKPSGRNAGVVPARLPNNHAVLTQLAIMTGLDSDSTEWYGFAEQALNAIYTLSKHPDVLCSEIIRHKTRQVFQRKQHGEQMVKTEASDDVEAGMPEEFIGPESPDCKPQKEQTQMLAHLLFIVGHVAIKQIVHLELCELDFKRRKARKEQDKASGTSPSKKKAEDENELDLIGGTTEDDFTEAIAHIREREILYGSKSLLATFGPMVAEICSNNNAYNDRNLQAVATICMAKLMCVSSEYCESHLPLLITILERSKDPITRSNVVIALGDMAVCFNNLVDENTDFLYRRLGDEDVSVKRTCLMTLTFLILAGQVKVKGQLGEMAKCLEDADKRIADLSRMFFTELAAKDNAVYNQFVDMFSVLSADKDLEEDAFRRIVKFMSSFIEKDKHAKQLSHKLAARLTRCDDERQWDDVVYALSLLQHRDEDIQKVVSEGFKLVQTAA